MLKSFRHARYLRQQQRVVFAKRWNNTASINLDHSSDTFQTGRKQQGESVSGKPKSDDEVMRQFFARLENARKSTKENGCSDDNQEEIFTTRKYPKRDDIDAVNSRVMEDFLGKLSARRKDSSNNICDSGKSDDKLLEILLKYSEDQKGHDESGAAELVDLSQPVSKVMRGFADKILKARTNHDLKDAICAFQLKFFSSSSLNSRSDAIVHASPKLLAAAISKSREFGEAGLAFYLLQQIKSCGAIAFVSWFNIHVYNELLYLDWEINRVPERLLYILKEAINSGIMPNSYTKLLLNRVRSDILKMDNFEKHTLAADFNHLLKWTVENSKKNTKFTEMFISFEDKNMN